MRYQKLVEDIIKNVGGRENVNSVVHCITRLRFILKDESKAKDDVLNAMEGVMKVIKSGGQYQVVIGTHVEEVYADLVKVGGFKGKPSEKPLEVTVDEEKKSLIGRFLNMLMEIFQPCLGMLAASGMIKAILRLFALAGWLDKTDGTYIILDAIGDALFYFFPIVLGWSSARRFKLKEVTGITLGAVLVYPSLVALKGAEPLYTLFAGTIVEQEITATFLKIPVIMPGYASTVIPIILTVFVASKIDKILNKVLPSVVRSFFVPFFTLLITMPLALIVIGPIAILLQDLLGALVTGLIGLNPGIAGLLLGTFWSILVIFGLHWGVIPMFALNVAAYGFDVINPLIFSGVWASMGAVIAVIIRTKSVKEKNIAIPALISTFFGVNEPTLYGVLIPRKRLMWATFLSAGIGSAIAGFSGSKLYAFGASGPLGMPCFINPDGIDGGFTGLLIGAVISLCMALVAGLVIGDTKEQEN